MPAPQGFSYEVRGTEVVITHHGKRAATLRAAAAARFLHEIETRDPQQLMARATGNYKRGNERRGRGRRL
jgi:antitoxin (DNA-binding transcriptional repressor) of toxin-antitoxin stability system